MSDDIFKKEIEAIGEYMAKSEDHPDYKKETHGDTTRWHHKNGYHFIEKRKGKGGYHVSVHDQSAPTTHCKTFRDAHHLCHHEGKTQHQKTGETTKYGQKVEDSMKTHSHRGYNIHTAKHKDGYVAHIGKDTTENTTGYSHGHKTEEDAVKHSKAKIDGHLALKSMKKSELFKSEEDSISEFMKMQKSEGYVSKHTAHGHTSWTHKGDTHDVVVHAPHPEGRSTKYGEGKGPNEGRNTHKTKYAVWSHDNKKSKGRGYVARHDGDFETHKEATEHAKKMLKEKHPGAVLE